MPIRGTSELHGYRWSAPETRYFVTACTRERRRGLEVRLVADTIIKSLANSESLKDTATLALCIMPGHIHWLFVLGRRLSLGRVVARLKAESRGTLASAGLAWQRDFFEHRLRADESVEDYGRYVFLNPYRAGLLAPNAAWAGWWCPRPEQLGFLARLNPDGSVPREWLGAAEWFHADGIQTGRD
jgi:putative transposase